MTDLGPERWRRISRVLDRALDLSGDARESWLREACAGDENLRRDVDAFLEADRDSGGFLASPTGAVVHEVVRMMGQGDASIRPDRTSILRCLADLPTMTGAPRTCSECGRSIPDGHLECRICTLTPANGPTGATSFQRPRQIGSYRIQRELGGGGMGTVFEAVDEKMNRTVALKIMARHLSASDECSRRFVHEAWIAGKLSHPNLVKVYERGEHEDLSFISMELVGGGSLHDLITNLRRRGRDDRWDQTFGSREYIRWAVKQGIAVARGLEYAHRQGVVHRDVKPMNLLLSRTLGTVKIADFGLAFEQDGTRLTAVGKVMGTASYMPPEQLLGKVEEIDARADIYALGATLYELLTLQLPHVASNIQSYMNAVLHDEPRRPSRLNERIGKDLETVVLKAIEKDPGDRYATAGAFAEDLQNVLDLRPIRARPPGPMERVQKWIRRKPMHAAVVGLLVVGLPLLGFFGQRELHRRALEHRERIEILTREAGWFDQRGRPNLAIARADEILRLDPDHPEGLAFRAMGRASLAVSANEVDTSELRRQALADISRVIEMDATSSWPHRVKAHLLDLFDGEKAAAEEEERARSLRGDTPTDIELRFDGRLAMHDEAYPRANEIYSELFRRNPADALAIAMRGMASDYLGDYEKAYREYRIAVGINPELHETYIDLGRLAAQHLRDYAEARDFVSRAIEIAPDNAHAHEMSSHILAVWAEHEMYAGNRGSAMDRFREAEAAARRSIEIEPERPWAYVNLGRAITERARLQDEPSDESILEAVGVLERALEIWDNPLAGVGEDAAESRAYAVSNVCDARLELGQPESALPHCLEATRMLPSNPVPFYNLAAAHAMMGQSGEALAALRRDLELGDTEWDYLEGDPKFDSLREDPDFRELVRAMKDAATEALGS